MAEDEEKDFRRQQGLNVAYRLGFLAGQGGLSNEFLEEGKPSREDYGRMWNKVYTMGHEKGMEANRK